MTWVRLDDQFFTNKKIRAAGLHGRALYVAGLVFCAQGLTDGHIPKKEVPLIALQAETKPRYAALLVELGLWDPVDDGYMVHDYLQFNPPAEKVKTDREEAALRMKTHRAKKRAEARDAERSQERSATPSPSPSVPSEQKSRGASAARTPDINLRALPAYNRPDLTPGCALCDGFLEVFDGNDRMPCPACKPQEATA